MSKRLHLLWKIPLAACLLLLVFGSGRDILFFDEGSHPLWLDQGTSRIFFFVDHIMTLLFALPALVAVWWGGKMRFRWILAAPLLLRLMWGMIFLE